MSPILTDDEILTRSHRVFVFSLSNKRWCMFHLDRIADVELNSEAFDSLLLPDFQKNAVLSLVNVHVKRQSNFDDVIKGKGRSLVSLLHGPPGLGKTLTAESVADHVQQPLYSISSGDLGIKAAFVEEKLTNALLLVDKWNAILLIDEADIFLTRRSDNDLWRNALVSIILRLLEYHQGIMFLTTNRMQSFDDAFRSRIHFAIKYHPLEHDYRKTLEKIFISACSQGPDKTPSACLDDSALSELAEI